MRYSFDYFVRLLLLFLFGAFFGRFVAALSMFIIYSLMMSIKMILPDFNIGNIGDLGIDIASIVLGYSVLVYVIIIENDEKAKGPIKYGEPIVPAIISTSLSSIFTLFYIRYGGCDKDGCTGSLSEYSDGQILGYAIFASIFIISISLICLKLKENKDKIKRLENEIERMNK